jgi:N-acetylglucosamine kinase
MMYGIDIGGTKIELAAFDDSFNPVAHWREATPTGDYDAFIETLAALVEKADAHFGLEGRVGLGLPGIVTSDGRSLCSNIPAATGRTIAKDLAARLGRHVHCENDCRCFAISEAVGGAGHGYRRVYGAIIGTGLSGGFVHDGKLMRGRQGAAGEHGHLQLPAVLAQKYDLPLRACGCGLPSCFESYASGPGLLFLHRHFGGALGDVPALARAWKDGDATAARTFDAFFDILGASFAGLVLTHDPDVFVLGGGVSLIDGLPERLPAAIEAHLFSMAKAPPVVRARFGDASGGRGAAILAAHAAGD